MQYVKVQIKVQYTAESCYTFVLQIFVFEFVSGSDNLIVEMLL